MENNFTLNDDFNEIITLFENSNKKIENFKLNFFNIFIFVMVFTISFYKLSGYSEFLYFRF